MRPGKPLEASGYDPELDELLQSVRDRAVELGAARRSAAESGLELARKRKAVDEQAGEIERLKEEAESARRSAEEAQRGFEAAEEALHRANRLNEANHLREGLVPGQPCPVCEQLVDTPASRRSGSRARGRQGRAPRRTGEAKGSRRARPAERGCAHGRTGEAPGRPAKSRRSGVARRRAASAA